MRWPFVKCWVESPATKYVSSSPPFCVICGNSVYSLNINWYFSCSVKCFQTSIITSSRCHEDSVTSRFRLRAVQQWWLLCINKDCHDSFWHKLSQIQEPSCHKVLMIHRGCCILAEEGNIKILTENQSTRGLVRALMDFPTGGGLALGGSYQVKWNMLWPLSFASGHWVTPSRCALAW